MRMRGICSQTIVQKTRGQGTTCSSLSSYLSIGVSEMTHHVFGLERDETISEEMCLDTFYNRQYKT